MEITVKPVVIEDYDSIYGLWTKAEQSQRALNPVDDSPEGIERYLKRNPATCFKAVDAENEMIIGVILSGHDGRRGMIHHLCVHPDYRNRGIGKCLVDRAEKALKAEGISKVFGLVFTDNDVANRFWEGQGYTLRTNINYRNKSLHSDVPTGE